MDNLLVIGAGVEKTKGLDMPLANELVPQIRDFLYKDETGKLVDSKLREVIKGLRFSYDDFINKAVDKLASDFKREVNSILRDIQETVGKENLDSKELNLAKIVIAFLGKIQKLQTDVALDDETAELIKTVFNEVEIGDENIIDLGKLSFSDTFEIVMKKILEISIKEPNHKVLKHVYRNLMDFENLLLKHFIGFYNDNESDVKKYLYISWTLWAFLVWKEKKVYQNNSKIPFYDGIKKADGVITFNYTSFTGKAFKQCKYFHGNLKNYIRLDNRGECQIDDYDNIDIVDFLDKEVKNNIDFEKKIYVIPSIVPPLKLKPVLSNEYIDIWHDSVEWIEKAKKIVVVGYSFNYADEHFNDIIRKHKDKPIYVIDPCSDNIIKNLKRIYSYRKEDYIQTSIKNKQAYKNDKLTIIEACATDINIDELFSM